MSYLIALFVLGFKHFFTKRNLIVFLVMFLLLLYAVNKGVDQYKELVDKSKEFQKVEAMKFMNVLNYTHYSFSGVRYLFVPAISAIFFTDSPMMSELSAKIDSVIALEIFSNFKGSGVFKVNNKGFLRFSGLIILLGTLFALFIGYESMRCKEYLKFLRGSFSHLKIFLTILFSRFFLMTLTIMLMFGSGIGLVKLRGIDLTSTDLKGLWIYVGVTILTLMIFLIIGSIIGTVRANTISVTLVLGVWILSVFIIPGILDSIIEERSNEIYSSYKTDLDKLQIIADFENNVEKKYGAFNRKNITNEREIIENYMKEVRPKIESNEKTLRGEIIEVIDKYKRLSILFPTTFYNLTALEVSSLGYENYLRFYNDLSANQRRFVDFWNGRVYYNDVNQLVSFVKGDEIIFHGRPETPTNLKSALGVHFFYIIMLLLGSYIRFTKWLDTPVDKKAFNKKDREICLRKDLINVLYSHRPGLRDQLYLVFSGKSIKSKSPAPSLQVTLEGEPFIGPSDKNKFVYICHPSAIPGDLRAADLISFIVRTYRVPAAEKAAVLKGLSGILRNGISFSRLEPHQQAEVLLSVLPFIKGDIFLVDQVGKDMPLSILVKLKDQLQSLAKTGALVIYLTPDKRVETMPAQPEREVLDLPEWFEAVEAHRFLLDEETGKWRTMPYWET